jgi:folate-binding protein YgfZ
VIAPLVVWRRGEDDFLLLTEPDLGDVVRGHLARMRLRARCEIESEEHESALVFGGEGIAGDFPGAVEVLDAGLEPTLSDEELELRRIEAGVPAWGRELDDRVLPAEAGLDRTHVSFTKGCYPGQEPIARLHYRGHVNRTLKVVELDEESEVERVTSTARRPDGTVVALAYVRT